MNMMTEDDVVYWQRGNQYWRRSLKVGEPAGTDTVYPAHISLHHAHNLNAGNGLKAGCFLRLKPGSHMPPMHLRHGRRYCLGYCSENRSGRQHCSSESLPPACLRGWLKFNFAGMSAVKLCDGSSCRRRMFSFVREVSQAVPAPLRRRYIGGIWEPGLMIACM